MSELDLSNDETAGGGGKKPLIFGLLAALILGGGGFYAAYSGLISSSGAKTEHAALDAVETARDSQDVAFVALDPLVVSLGHNATNRYLRFSAQLEVVAEFEEEVTKLMPRVLDVLNGYLRAVDSQDIENPSALGRLRAQMLRRVQVVTGNGWVRDLLITEFVLN